MCRCHETCVRQDKDTPPNPTPTLMKPCGISAVVPPRSNQHHVPQRTLFVLSFVAQGDRASHSILVIWRIPLHMHAVCHHPWQGHRMWQILTSYTFSPLLIVKRRIEFFYQCRQRDDRTVPSHFSRPCIFVSSRNISIGWKREVVFSVKIKLLPDETDHETNLVHDFHNEPVLNLLINPWQ